MANVRNEAPKAQRGVRCGEGMSPSPPVLEEGTCPSPENWAQNGKFWRIVGANFIAVELSVSHA